MGLISPLINRFFSWISSFGIDFQTTTPIDQELLEKKWRETQLAANKKRFKLLGLLVQLIQALVKNNSALFSRASDCIIIIITKSIFLILIDQIILFPIRICSCCQYILQILFC